MLPSASLRHFRVVNRRIPEAMSRKFLKRRHIHTLLALSAHIVPPCGPAVNRLAPKILLHIDHSLRGLPGFLRRLFVLGLTLFDYGPVIFSSQHRSFRKLPYVQQRDFLHRLQSQRLLAVLRGWLFAVRGLILLCYYSQPGVMTALGYSPERWARQKIHARRRALKILESEHLEPRKLKKLRADYS